MKEKLLGLRARLFAAALALPVIGVVVHAVAHVLAPLFGLPCP